MARYHKHFDSYGEALDFIKDTPSKGWSDTSAQPGNSVWAGTSSLDAALELARTGWAEGVDKLDRAFTVCEARRKAISRRPRGYDVVGDTFDVQQMIEGQRELFEVPAERVKRKRIVRLLVNNSYPGHAEPDQVIRYFAAIASLVAAIEERGDRCEVVLAGRSVYGDEPNKTDCQMDIVLKRPGDTLNMMQLAFPLIHPASLRRIGFALRERIVERADAKASGYSYSYGYSVVSDTLGVPDSYVAPLMRDWIEDGGDPLKFISDWWANAQA